MSNGEMRMCIALTKNLTPVALAVVLILVASSCGGGDDDSPGGDTQAPTAVTDDDSSTDTTAEDTPDSNPTTTANGSASEEGSLTINQEEIALGRGLCFLEEQDAAAGGGTIELTGQATGTSADGTPVLIDFTRFGEDSQFAGDDVSVTLGDPFSANALTSFGRADIGAVALDGNVLSATDFPLIDDQGSEEIISFTIVC